MDQFSDQHGFTPRPSQEAEPVIPSSTELDSDIGLEKAPRGAEMAPNPETKKPSDGHSLPPVQVPIINNDDDDDQADEDSDEPNKVVVTTPMIAEDVDVIEMEWVDKAKKIIKQTRNDPYAQEEAMEQLQIEYLRKRYGKEIKKTKGL